jgi:hypothetical protein
MRHHTSTTLQTNKQTSSMMCCTLHLENSTGSGWHWQQQMSDLLLQGLCTLTSPQHLHACKQTGEQHDLPYAAP